MTLLGGISENQLPEALLAKLNHKSLLVTGASGVVGLNLLALLSDVILREKLQTTLYGLSRTGIVPLVSELPHPLQIQKSDLLDPGQIDSLPSFDFVIHGATYGQPARFLAEPAKTILLNTQVTSQLKALTKERFLFISSSEVYSGLENGPFKESQIGTTNTTHPRAPYIEGKRAGESLTLARGGPGPSGTVARLSLAYGPGARAGDRRVLYELIARGIANKRVDLRGGGNSIRSYLFAEDAAHYLINILVNGEESIYNVGGSRPILLSELAQNIAEIMKVDFDIQESPEANLPQSGAPDDVRLDMTRTEALVGGLKQTALGDGLAATITWMQKVLSNSGADESRIDRGEGS